MLITCTNYESTLATVRIASETATTKTAPRSLRGVPLFVPEIREPVKIVTMEKSLMDFRKERKAANRGIGSYHK